MIRSEGNMSLKIPVTPPGIDPGTVRLVAQRLSRYATPDPADYSYVLKIHYIFLSSSSPSCSFNPLPLFPGFLLHFILLPLISFPQHSVFLLILLFFIVTHLLIFFLSFHMSPHRYHNQLYGFSYFITALILIYMYMCVCVCVYTYIYISIYVYINIHIHTYIYIYMHVVYSTFFLLTY